MVLSISSLSHDDGCVEGPMTLGVDVLILSLLRSHTGNLTSSRRNQTEDASYLLRVKKKFEYCSRNT